MKEKVFKWVIFVETVVIGLLIATLILLEIPIFIYSIDPQSIATIISAFVASVAFIVILWDHTIDDRNLTKRVSNFYRAYESFIYYYYEHAYFVKYYNLKKIEQINDKCDYLYGKFLFYQNLIRINFPKYSNYIGLVEVYDEGNHVFYMNEEGKVLSPSGYLSDISEKDVFSDDQIRYIHGFLKELRTYWGRNHSKTLLKMIKIRPKLNKHLNFYKLSWYKKNSKIKLDDDHYILIE